MMQRRDVPKFLLTSAALGGLTTAAQAQTCGTGPCYPQTAAESAAGVTPQNYSFPPGNVLRYYSGSGDASSAVQQCLNANPNCYFPAGNYAVASTVNVGDAQLVYGDNRKASVISSPAGVQTFLWHPAGALDREGPGFRDLQINSDYPITINALTTFLQDGSGDSPCRGALFEDLLLNSVTPSAGYGVCASKMFDSTIARCLITGYAVGILMNGSDINHVYDNRLVAFSEFGILDNSGQTFGSQNEISHNDILDSAGSTAIYIKSTSIHVRICDNYMESPGGACTGFVDISQEGMPAIFGSNVAGSSYFTVAVSDNRIDGQAQASTFVYRIDPNRSVSIVCEDVNTTGVPGSSFFTSDVLVNYNQFNGKTIRIRGQSWGIWDGYTSRQAFSATGGCISCTGENLPAFIWKDGNPALVIRSSHIVLPASFSSLAWVVPNATWVENRLFQANTTYTARVIARSTAASGDTLNIALGSQSFGSILNSFPLTDQFTEYSWTFGGRPRTGNDLMGFYMTRTGNVGDIEIAVISFS